MPTNLHNNFNYWKKFHLGSCYLLFNPMIFVEVIILFSCWASLHHSKFFSIVTIIVSSNHNKSKWETALLPLLFHLIQLFTKMNIIKKMLIRTLVSRVLNWFDHFSENSWHSFCRLLRNHGYWSRHASFTVITS